MLLLLSSLASYQTASGFSSPSSYRVTSTDTSGFSSPSSYRLTSSDTARKDISTSIVNRRAWILSLSSSSKDIDSWDSEEDYAEFNKNLDGPADDDFELNFLSQKGKLGIDIGKEMGISKLSPEEAAELKREASEAIESAFSSQLQELDKLRQNMKKDFEDSRQAMNAASDLRASREAEQLLNKIDAMTGDFLRETKRSRDSTKLAATADHNMVGRGLEFGSWGTDDSGREVVTLGDTGSSFYIEESLDDIPAGDRASHSKILVVVDESKVCHSRCWCNQLIVLRRLCIERLIICVFCCHLE